MAQSHLHDQFMLKPTEDREAAMRLKNRRTGVAIFQASWIMAFICLVVVNLQLRSGSPSWPPEGVAPLDRVIPTLATVALLISGWFARRGSQSIAGDDRERYLVQWRIALGLGIAFVAVMAFEWLTVTPVPESSLILANGLEVSAALTQYNAIFRVMTAFHGFHALVICVYMFNTFRAVRGSAATGETAWAVEAGAKLWYFVVIAWLMFYTVLYWI
jgi:heme/copper-type cytochrome/quinol oxidase subunit 3